MSYSIKKTNISLTRGDTLQAKIELFDTDGNPYQFQEGDSVRFAMKKHYLDDVTLINKEIPTDTMVLILDPMDTKRLDFGEYVYDIQLTTHDGIVDTFIDRASIVLTEEVE